MPTTVPSKNDLDKLLAKDASLTEQDALILARLSAVEARLDKLEAGDVVEPPDVVDPPPPPPPPPPDPEPEPPIVVPPGDHGYFQALQALPAHRASWSLRDPAQLVGPRSGGFASGNCPPVIVYDPVMDAARAAIAPFQQAGVCEGHHLTAPMSATDTVLTMSVVSSTYGPPGQRQLKIGDEILELRPLRVDEGGDGIRAYNATTKQVAVVRGQYGTVAAAHAVGDLVLVSGNQIGQMIHLPVNGREGHTTVITWDGWWDQSYVGQGRWNTGQKTFQITDAKNSKLLEVKVMFATDADTVGRIAVRAYETPFSGIADWSQTNGNTLGPGTTGSDTFGPSQPFIVKPNVVTRFWAVIESNPMGWDYFSLYVATAETGVVYTHNRLAFSIERANPPLREPLIGKWWWELGDSSTEYARGALFDLVSYVRNVAVLEDVDLTSVLVAP